ncbi:MAG: HlyC/CorC family transporter [Alphaproteobacteria bacterium]|nr:HlyC/CorC family transporter [Alphaproteobacteria bacterium]
MNDDPSHSRRNPAPKGNGEQSLLGALTGWLRTLGGGRADDGNLRDSVEDMLEERTDGRSLTAVERSMLANLLRFGELRVDDVMVPGADIVAVDQEASIDELVAVIRDSQHSRLPVFDETLDNVIGVIHARDLIAAWGGASPPKVKELVRPVLFVPPSMRVTDLLLQMRATGNHLAVVVDEYGGTDGLITIEDVIEEIVGDIRDEHDEAEGPLLEETADGFIADARASVEDLEARVGHALLPEDEEEDVETVGGLVFSLAGRVPARGEIIPHPAGLEFEVLDADPRRVKRVRIRHVAPPLPAPGAGK